MNEDEFFLLSTEENIIDWHYIIKLVKIAYSSKN